MIERGRVQATGSVGWQEDKSRRLYRAGTSQSHPAALEQRLGSLLGGLAEKDDVANAPSRRELRNSSGDSSCSLRSKLKRLRTVTDLE
jgi:hypothetical protein